MKRTFSFILILVLGLMLLSSCGRPDTGSGSDTADDESTGPQPVTTVQDQSVDIDKLETIGDIIDLQPDEFQTAAYDDKYIYVFKANDTYYRAIADISGDVGKKILELDVTEEGYDGKMNELVSPLKIDKLEDLSEKMLKPEDLNALAGKTGEELIADGWTVTGYDLDSMMFYMDKGAFEYQVYFEGAIEDKENFNEEEGIKPLTVRSAEISGLGDSATEVE